MTPNTIQFRLDNPTEVLRLSKEGITANPDIPIDEAAKLVLAAIDDNIKALVKQERADEREACAKFIEDEYVRQFVRPWRKDLAAAIRARGNT